MKDGFSINRWFHGLKSRYQLYLVVVFVPYLKKLQLIKVLKNRLIWLAVR